MVRMRLVLGLSSLVLGATFNAAYYLVQKLLGSEHHMSISISPLMHDVSAATSAQFCAALRNSLTPGTPARSQVEPRVVRDGQDRVCVRPNER